MKDIINVIRLKGDRKKIHYMNRDADAAYCGASGPFKETVISYKDRYENMVCKTCFKKFIISQRNVSKLNNENGGEES